MQPARLRDIALREDEEFHETGDDVFLFTCQPMNFTSHIFHKNMIQQSKCSNHQYFCGQCVEKFHISPDLKV